MGQLKIYSVWKTTLLLNTGLLSGLSASSGTLFFCVSRFFLFFFQFGLHFQLVLYGIYLKTHGHVVFARLERPLWAFAAVFLFCYVFILVALNTESY